MSGIRVLSLCTDDVFAFLISTGIEPATKRLKFFCSTNLSYKILAKMCIIVAS
jgi:hypothetical protein